MVMQQCSLGDRARVRTFDTRHQAIIVGIGPGALLSCVRRCFSRRMVLLAYLGEPPAPRPSWMRRLVLRRADAILVEGDATLRAVSGLTHATHRIASCTSLNRYFQVKVSTLPASVRRVVVVGDLTPGSGVSDLLATLAAWAEINPGLALELNWVGTGALAAVLAAQPIPANLTQIFHGALDDRATAAVFAQGGLLAVSSVADGGDTHVTGALAAGLPVLGSRRSAEVRRHVTDEATGWLFDPMRPGDMLAAVTRAFAADEQRLATMGAEARLAVTALPSDVVIAPASRRVRRGALMRASAS